jgi:hypothetical protein
MATKESIDKRNAKRKRKVPGKIHIYVKVFKGESDAAHVFLCSKPWNEVLPALNGGSSVNDFFSSSVNRKEKRFNGIIAVGRLRLREKHTYLRTGKTKMRKVYCPTYTRVKEGYSQCGFGILLYKVMLLAAQAHAKQRRRKHLLFGADQCVGGSTSNTAWRCYTSLARKGYIRNMDRKQHEAGTHRKYDYFKVDRLPKNIKPTFIMAA